LPLYFEVRSLSETPAAAATMRWPSASQGLKVKIVAQTREVSIAFSLVRRIYGGRETCKRVSTTHPMVSSGR
jgi:hypothetical protein